MNHGPSTEVRQDYLKIILGLNDEKANGKGFISNKEIANAFHVQPPSVTGIMAKLQQAGLVDWQKRKGARLTANGLAYAKRILEMHRIVESFLATVLKASDAALMQRVACKMEHILLDEPGLARILEESIDDARQRLQQGTAASDLNE
ncbi:MAG: metal-dependent transcriptional regulator [Candidatus Lokiarchaeota archaeon]|nr:metal-dependent transcriptional regulator [Candidatus Lokiarchaeota archaeon]